MKNNNLFFHYGEGPVTNQQIVLSKDRVVTVIDGDSELQIEGVKKIEIKSADHGKLKISLGPQISFISSNHRVVINEIKDKVVIEMLTSDEQLMKYVTLVNAQQAKGIIDYIMEYAPDLYSKENLQMQSLTDLLKIKENMDDLANCY